MTTITDPEALPSADATHRPGELRTVPHWRAGAPFAGESDPHRPTCSTRRPAG